MARMLKILVLLSFIIAVFGRSVKVQIEFEDVLKLLPFLRSSENLKEIVSSLTRPTNVRAVPSASGRYNNPYHPEDDLLDPIELFRHSDDESSTEKEQSLAKESLDIYTGTNNELLKAKKIKAQKMKKVDIDMEKDNDNFVKDKQSISEDELTEFVNDVNSLSASVQKIAQPSDIARKDKVNDITITTPITALNDTETDDRFGFKSQVLQKRFILKNSGHKNTSGRIETTQGVFSTSQDLSNSDSKVAETSDHLDKSVRAENFDNSAQLDQQDTDHVAKRNETGAKRLNNLAEGKKYAGFVVKPGFLSTDLPTPVLQETKDADNDASETLKNSANMDPKDTAKEMVIPKPETFDNLAQLDEKDTDHVVKRDLGAKTLNNLAEGTKYAGFVVKPPSIHMLQETKYADSEALETLKDFAFKDKKEEKVVTSNPGTLEVPPH